MKNKAMSNLEQIGYDVFYGETYTIAMFIDKQTRLLSKPFFSITVSYYPNKHPKPPYYIVYGHSQMSTAFQYFDDIGHIDWQAVANVVNSDLTSEAKTLAVTKIISGE